MRAAAIGSSLGTLGNIALTWEGRAGKILGRLGMAGSLACGFLEMLCPPADPPPPITKQDLANALNDVEKVVIDSLVLHTDSIVRANVDGFSIDFQDKWIDLTLAQLETQKDSAGKIIGSTPVINETDPTIKSAVEEADQYYFPKGTNARTLDTWRLQLEDPDFTDSNLTAAQLAQRAILTMELYLFIGSLQVAYHQASVAWRWGQEMLMAAQVAGYNKDHDDWSAQCDAHANYAKNHPEADLLNPYPDLMKAIRDDHNFLTNYTVKDWGAWAKVMGSPVHRLQEVIDNLLTFCIHGTPAKGTIPAKPGFYTELRKNWDALEAAVVLSAHVAGAKPSCIEMTTGMVNARLRVVAWSQQVVANSLQGVAEDDVIGFGQTVDAWRTVRASVSFRYYTTVTAQETLTSVAQDQYGDASLASKIAQYNPDVTAGVHDPLPLPTELKIFDKDWLPYVDLKSQLWPRPKVQQAT